MRIYLTLIILCVAGLAHAQSNVEVNMEVLDNYNPPPMFGIDVPPSDPAKDAMLPMPNIKRQKTVIFIPPLPAKKPVYTGGLVQNTAPSGETVYELAEPSARDILATIDPDAELPPEQMQVEEPEKERVFAEKLPDIADALTIEFDQGDAKLKSSISNELLKRISFKTETNPNARIELRAFARDASNSESTERRLSLARALRVRKALTESDISTAIIDIRPLGRHTTKDQAERVDIIFTNGG